MRSKEKVANRNEILRNFTREFLIEEKRRCEIDRYVTDFRILIHKRPHENHNYLNRLLQDYTTMFLSHERISANKMNQEDVKHQLRTQLMASRKKDSPKQRYVKSKLSDKNETDSEHHSYLVLKAKTEEFLRKLKEYDALEQIAYEIFIKNFNPDDINSYQYEMEPNTVLKLKSSDVPLDIPYKKHYRNVYVVNSPKPIEKNSEKQTDKKEKLNTESKNTIENYAIVKKETENFLKNNRDYNDAERKMLSEQYQNNTYIKRYVDTLTSSEKCKKDSQSPKKGIFSKIKNMMGFSPESSTKFYKNVENNHEALVDKTKLFLRNERKYSNFEYEAYKLFYIKHGEFQNPLIEVIKKIAYEKQDSSNKSSTENGKNTKIKQKLALKNPKTNQRSTEEKEFENFNLVRCSPTEKNEPEQKMKDIRFQFESPTIISTHAPNKNANETSSRSPNEEFIILRENANEFLNKQKLYEDQQRYYYVVHMRKYYINPIKEKKESLFSKIKHLFFGRQDKSKEKNYFFKEITLEFLRNEQYYHDLQKQAFYIFSKNHNYSVISRDLGVKGLYHMRNEKEISEHVGKTPVNRKSVDEKLTENVVRPRKLFEETNLPTKKEKHKKNGKSATLRKQDKVETSPPSLHHRSKSEDLLMFRTKTKSLESKKSPTGHKTFSDRLKSMVGIGNRSRTKSRDMLLPTDPLQYFLDHERFYYEGIPQKQDKYARSVSSIEYMPKDGTIKTKTRRFLSTENVLYQDHNTSLVNKPPSGRRRKEERNRESKEKRRSRTLSPAQKLVSKIKNLVQKNNNGKLKEDTALIRKETGEFLSDHRRFNDLLGSNFDDKSRSVQKESNTKMISTSSVFENIQIAEENKNTSPSQMNVIFVKVEKKALNSTEKGNENKKLHTANDKDKLESNLLKPNILDDPGFVNNQTKLFLIDLKKYHDLDKEPNTIDKTLIFVNNKDDNKETREVKNEWNLNRNIQIASKGSENIPMESTLKNTENSPETHTEKITQVRRIVRDDNTKTDESNTRVIHNTIMKETGITKRITTKNVQRTTRKIFSKWSDEPEHIYENVSYPENTSTCNDTKSHFIRYETNETLHEVGTPKSKMCSPREITVTYDKKESIKNATTDQSMKILKQDLSSDMLKTKSDKDNVEQIINVSAPIAKEHKTKKYNTKMIKNEESDSTNKDMEYKNNSTLQSKFSKPGTTVLGAWQKPSSKKSDTTVRLQTTEFLDDLKKHHDGLKRTKSNNTVVWLSEQKDASPMHQTQPSRSVTMIHHQTSKSIAMTLQERELLKSLRKNTDIFLKDHQAYHNKQRTEDNEFFVKLGKPEYSIWLSSRPNKKKDNIITKVKQLISPLQSKKSLIAKDEAKNKIVRDKTDEFLRRHQYMIYKEEIDMKRIPISKAIVNEKVTILSAEKQNFADATQTTSKKGIKERKENASVEKSPEKEIKSKKSTFSKLKSYVVGESKNPSTEESNILTRQQTSEFLDDMRKYHDGHKNAITSYNIVWLSEQKVVPTQQLKHQTKTSRTIAMTDKEKEFLRSLRQNTDTFLKDHQDYHNKQRIRDNDFFAKLGKPENLIWLSSRPNKKKDNIITKVKYSMSPQHSKKSLISADEAKNKIIRDQTDEFLRKHQYKIYKEEIDFKRVPISKGIVNEKATIISAERQNFADVTNTASEKEIKEKMEKSSVEKSPEKEMKSKKSTFSKLKTYVVGASKNPSTEESNKLLHQQTSEFLDDMRKYHDGHKKAITSHNIVWLSEQKVVPTKQLMHQTQTSKPMTMTDQEEEFLRSLRQNTDTFLKDHQDYHNKQRIGDNDFFAKLGKPNNLIWLSSRPNKKKDNIISKVKHLLSPHNSKKTLISTDEARNRIIRDQTDEFLRRHQYMIYKEEIDMNRSPISKAIVNEKVTILYAEKQNFTDVTQTTSEKGVKERKEKASVEKSPEKEIKSKTTTFSKLKSYVVGATKTPSTEESNKLLHQQTSEFLDDMRKYHDGYKKAITSYNIVWLSEQEVVPTKQLKHQNQTSKPIAMTDKETEFLTSLRQNTDTFLKDHQDYHNKQRIGDNDFFAKLGKPENLVWLSFRPDKKKDNILTRVKHLMSPQHSKKRLIPTDEAKNKIIREQTDEFLRKHQYKIYKEEIEFKRVPISKEIVDEKVTISSAEKQNSVDVTKTSSEKEIKERKERASVEKSPEKEMKSKKSTFSKLKSYVVGASKIPSTEESNKLLHQQTSEFLDDMRKYHDGHKKALSSYNIVWLSEQKVVPTKQLKHQTRTSKPITMTDKEKEFLRSLRQNTDTFLKDHQDYHNKQRIGDNDFFAKLGKPENLVWLSFRPDKKKDNIMTKVKHLMSPQHSKKRLISTDEANNKIIRDQTDEFLRKHQYKIYKEEIDFKRVPISKEIVNEKVTILSAEKQNSADVSNTASEKGIKKRKEKASVEKSPEKEMKSKKSTFSKLKSYVVGASKNPSTEESNKLLHQQTSEFLDDMRKYHDGHKKALSSYNIVWLSEQKVVPTKQLKHQTRTSKPITMTDKEKEFLRSLRQNTDTFLKDHQDYHNKQRNADKDFFAKLGKPENLIWLSSRPDKKKDNIITKVKHLMSPQHSKKSLISTDEARNKIIRDQTDEFLRKHQYKIYKEEIDFNRVPISKEIVNEKVTILSAEKQNSADVSNTASEKGIKKRKEKASVEKSPEKEMKSKKSTFSKLKSYVVGASKNPSTEESNKLLHQQTSEFLDDMKKYHDGHKNAIISYNIVWLSEQEVVPTKQLMHQTETSKATAMTDKEKEFLRSLRQNTDTFLKDHQDYHNKQRIGDNDFFAKLGKPENLIWLSSRPDKKKDNIITKVKHLMSPQNSEKSLISTDEAKNKIIRDQTDEFLRKHQYKIYKEEIDFNRVPISKEIVNEKVTTLSAEKQNSADVSNTASEKGIKKRKEKASVEKSPEKEMKSKKSTFSKLKSYVVGASKNPSTEESNKLLHQQTSEFLDDMKKYHDGHKKALPSYNIVWLSEQEVVPTKQLMHQTETSKATAMTDKEKEFLRSLRQNTDTFLKDHQDYHNKQRNADKDFFAKLGKPENLIWLSSRPDKKKDNIITKVKHLMSPQHSKKSLISTDEAKNKIIRDQTDEFLRKHQYKIYKEEIDFNRVPISKEIVNEKVTILSAEKQNSADVSNTASEKGIKKRKEKASVEKSPEKEMKSKKSTFSKLKSYVVGASKNPSTEESNKLLHQQTSEFLDDMKKYHDGHKKALSSYNIVWLSEQEVVPTKQLMHQTETSKATAMTDKEKEFLRSLRQNTDTFLKDHQDYHNKQRIGDNDFFAKLGKPENLIWLSSRPDKKKDNIITKVKHLMSPQNSKKSLISTDEAKNKIIRDQTDEFLRKHQYKIYKEEIDFNRVPISKEIVNEKVTTLSAEKQNSADVSNTASEKGIKKRKEKASVEKSPEKEMKSKKSTFSKLKSYVVGASKNPSTEESNKLLHQQTSEFLDDMKKYHDGHKKALSSHNIVWLSEQKVVPTKQLKHQTRTSKPITMTDKEKEFLRLLRQNTDTFLKDHQDYHNKQRIGDNDFFAKLGKPENLVWLSFRPDKKKDNILTKVKHLMSPQHSKKRLISTDEANNKIIRDQTDEFLRKHQYKIYKEEIDFNRVPISKEIVNEKVTILSAEKQNSADVSNTASGKGIKKRNEKASVEKSPEKEMKSKKSTFSKLKSYVVGASKNPSTEESNKLLHQQTSEFLDDMKTYHDGHKNAIISYNIVWLSEQEVVPTKQLMHQTETSKATAMTDKEKEFLRSLRQNTDTFLKDHQDYHNKQRIGDNDFFAKLGKPENLIWLSSRPDKKKDNIITKVKHLMSPQNSKKSHISTDEAKTKFIRDETNEFLRKHQYKIYKEEIDFNRVPISKEIVNEKVTILSAEKQNSVDVSNTASEKGIKKRKERASVEKSPEKEMKSKKSTFSKLKSYVVGASKNPSTEESNKLLHQQTSEFLDDMKTYHDGHKNAIISYNIVWLSEQEVVPTKQLMHQTETSKATAMTDKEKEFLRSLRQNTDTFLKDHQDYHNKQRIGDNDFFAKLGKPENLIWLSSRPDKKKDNIITKVKHLMSPQNSKKSHISTDEAKNKIIRDQTNEFLRKHQYKIYKEEIDFNRVPISKEIVNEKVTILSAEKQNSVDVSNTASEKGIKKRKERASVEKSPEKEMKSKKSTCSKLKSYVVGASKNPSTEESNKLLHQQTSEFLDDMKKYHDGHKKALSSHKIVWLSEQEVVPTKQLMHQTETSKATAMTDKEKEFLRSLRQNTDTFLKDHQDYHNKQRIGDNDFFAKLGKPENLIWLSSRPDKKKDNILTKVKHLMSPQNSKKSLISTDDAKNTIIKDQTDEFLRKHQYKIYKEEIEFKRVPISKEIVNEKVAISSAEKQNSVDVTKTSSEKKIKERKERASVEKSPEKEMKSRKSTFSKLKSYVVGASKIPSTEESNKLLHQQTSEFLDDMRKYHDGHKKALSSYNIVWLSEQKVVPTKQLKHQTRTSKPITMTDKEKEFLRSLRQNTDTFLKDHQDYHNKQRIGDNDFFAKLGKPENLVWLSFRPDKKKDNIMTKVKHLMSPQHSKKRLISTDEANNKIIRDQTDEFLRKHQYKIYKEEIDFNRVSISKEIVNEKVTILSAEKQNSADVSNTASEKGKKKRKEKASVEKSPEKEMKSKKSTFSKLKSYVVGASKNPSTEESNKLLHQQTSEFLDDMKKYHDGHKKALPSYNIVWLSEQEVAPTKQLMHQTETSKATAMTDKEKEFLRSLRQNTDTFLKDHQDYHNKQRIGDKDFFAKLGKPENLIWLSSRPDKKKDNIITKVKHLMSPQNSKKSLISTDEAKKKIIRDHTDEFLRKHQYKIDKEEIDFNRVPISKEIVNEKVTILSAEKQNSADVSNTASEKGIKKRKEKASVEKSPEKEMKSKKSTFSKLKSYVVGASKNPSTEESNKLLHQQTSEFLDDMKKYHDGHKTALASYNIVWLSEQMVVPTKQLKHQTQTGKPITITDKEKEFFRSLRQNTDTFLKDHQDYHNKQRIGDNDFFAKLGKPENLIWLSSRPDKKKDNIITKVKYLMSPQHSKKTLISTDNTKNKIIRDQTDEFLRKHQYMIYEDEIDFKRIPISKAIVNENVTILSAKKQNSADVTNTASEKEMKERKEKAPVEKSPEKEIKSKKGTFSKLKSYVVWASKNPFTEESDKLLRQLSSKFLDDMRKYHDGYKEAITSYNIVWLSEQKVAAAKQPKDQTSKSIGMTQQKEEFIRSSRENTEFFLKDHQDFHNKQRIEDNDFFDKLGKPEYVIWRSSHPNKERDNLITKNTIIGDQTDEYLRKQQYNIYEEEFDFKRIPISKTIVDEKVTISSPEKQNSVSITKARPEKGINVKTEKASVENSPEIEMKSKNSTFSKLKSYVIGAPKTISTEESNKLLLQQTSEFLDDMKKHHDRHKNAITSYNIIWLSEQKALPTKQPQYETQRSKPMATTQQEKELLRLVRHNTSLFLEDHKNYHNKQKSDENEYSKKFSDPQNTVWLSSTPIVHKEISEPAVIPTPRKNIISKVKNILSPSRSDNTTIFYCDVDNQIGNQIKKIKEGSNESLNMHQHETKSQLCLSDSSIENVASNSDLPLRQIPRKKVTFSETDTVEKNTSCKQDIRNYSNHSSHDDYQNYELNSSSKTTFDTDKPQIIPRKQVPKKVKTLFIDSAEIFRQDKEHYLIESTRQFLEDHKNHQNSQWIYYQNADSVLSEKSNHQEQDVSSKYKPEDIPRIMEQMTSSSSQQQKTSIKESDDVHSREPKLKSKLMTKLKSLMGSSQDIISPDKKSEVEHALIRKQTLEFLISQKCYNDLEGDACHKFGLKQAENKNFSIKSEPQEDEAVDSSLEHKNDSNSALEGDSTFCSPRKLPVVGSPKYHEIKSQEPQKSSLDKKISKKAEITIKEKSDSKINQNIVYKEKSMEQNKDFLDDEKNYETSEHEIRKQYLKSKPEASSNKKLVGQEEFVQKYSDVQNMVSPKCSIKNPSSEIESDRIDQEVILHKTPQFLEVHQNNRDNLQELSSNYSPRQADMSDVQNKNPTSIYMETHKILERSPFPNQSEMELTLLFLKDHQKHHDLERSHISKYKWKADEREKKPRKGVISKIKSLVTGDKKTSSKKILTASLSENPENVDRKVSNEKVDDIIIRELESSPVTYRKNKPTRSSEGQIQEAILNIHIDSEILSTDGDTKIMTPKSHSQYSESKITEKNNEPKILEGALGTGYKMEHENKLMLKKLSYDEIKILPEDERRKYATAKIKTQEFLLNQKQFSNNINNYISQKPKGIKERNTEIGFIENSKSEEKNPSEQRTDISEQKSREAMEKIIFLEKNTEHAVEKSNTDPSAPSLIEGEELIEEEKGNIQSVVHRVVKPLSPTKTIFKEIKKREDTPDRKVYIMKEGYIMTKENKDGFAKDHAQTSKVRRQENISAVVTEENSKEQSEEISRNVWSHEESSTLLDTRKSTEGQDYVDENDDSPSRAVPQGDLEVRRHSTKNCYFIFLVVLVVLIAIYLFKDEEDEN